MRWFWIDRFVEFERGKRAVSIKNVTLSEEPLDDYVPTFAHLTGSLIIEGMAQTGGLVVNSHSDFRQRVVLAKVGKAHFHRPAFPGDTLRYTAVIEGIQDDGAICHGTVHVGDELQAEIELVFAQLDDRFQGIEQFKPADFVRTLRLLKLFDVYKSPDGEKLPIPDYLLEAEEAEAVADRG